MGTLRKAATYPEPAESKLLAEITHAFELVGLSHLVDSLEEEGPWDQTLSGGENSGSHLHELSCIDPTSSCWTRPHRRWTRPVKMG
jgi:putative ATP-binding cassette transporter